LNTVLSKITVQKVQIIINIVRREATIQRKFSGYFILKWCPDAAHFFVCLSLRRG